MDDNSQYWAWYPFGADGLKEVRMTLTFEEAKQGLRHPLFWARIAKKFAAEMERNYALSRNAWGPYQEPYEE